MSKYDLTKIDLREMSSLFELITKLNYGDQYRMAACLVTKNEHIWGYNQKKTHPLMLKYQKNPDAITLHAEIDAIRYAIKDTKIDLSKSILYVGRVKFDHPQERKNVWGMAKPCKGCMNAIEAFEIPRVVYSTDAEGPIPFEVMVR